MATFMDHKTAPGPKEQPKKKVPNPTLENVAEEVLNGMMCHYEPPDPKRVRRPVKRGILRQPTVAGGKSKQQKQVQSRAPRNRVRWEDEKAPTPKGKAAAAGASKQDPPAMNPVCGGFGQACYDAGMEVGCVPDANKKKQMNATEAIAVAKAKSPSNNRNSGEELVIDEEGNLTYSDPKKKGQPPPPPPPPPPPRERELFMPQFCGVRIKCGDDDASNDPPLPALASRSSSFDTTNLASPERSAKEDDETNSLLDDEEDEDEDSDEQPVFTRKESPKAETRKKKREKVATVDFAELKESIDDWESQSPASSLFHRVFPLKKTKEKKNAPARRNSMDSSSEGDSDTSERGRSRSRSRSPFRRNRNREGDKDKEEVDRYHDRSMSPDALARLDNTSRNVSKQKKFGLKFLKGVSPRSKKLSSEGDWDDSIPIVPPSLSDPPRSRGRSRSRSPKLSERKKTRSQSPLLHRTRILPISDARDLPPLPEEDLQKLQPQITYPAFHPAYPLKQQQWRGESGHPNDATERMSYITAHREGFEGRPPLMGTQNSICGMAAPQSEDVDRQSFITAHRQTFDSSVPVAPYPGQQLVPVPIADDALERQSFITAHRQTFAGGDDSDERQSFITAHRQAFDPVTVHNPGPVLNRAGVDLAKMGPLTLSPGPIQRKPSPRRGRSRSPRRSTSPSRRRSKSPSQKSQNTGHDPNHMLPLTAPPVVIYDPRTGMHHLPPPGYLPPVYEYPQTNPIQQFYAQQAIKGQPPMMYQNGPVPMQPCQEGIYCGPAGIPQNFSAISAQSVVNESSAEPDRQEAVKEEELSWEERTRLAWERIRGGVEAAFNMEPTKPDGDEKDEDAENVQNPSPDDTPSSPEKHPHSPDKQIHQSPQKQQDPLQPKSPISIVQQRAGSPQSILRTPSSEMRRVTFGEAQERIFYDDQDENRSQMTYADPNRKKKKKRFRGTKLISGVLGKMKNTAGKVNLALSKSNDSEPSSINYSSSSSSPSQDSAAEYGHLQGVLSDQSSASSQQRYSNRQPQPQAQQVNPLREQNGRNA